MSRDLTIAILANNAVWIHPSGADVGNKCGPIGCIRVSMCVFFSEPSSFNQLVSDNETTFVTTMAAATSHFYRAALRRMPPLHPSRQCRASSTSGPDKTRPAKQAPRQESIPVPPTVAPLPIWQRLGPLTRAGEAYARSQRKRPYVTQVASALVVYLCADLSAQSMGGKDEHDLARTGRSLIIGAAAAIPGYEWYVRLSACESPVN